VTVGNIVVTDVDPAAFDESQRRSLDVSFSTESHTKLEPLATEVTVYGLSEVVRTQMLAQQKAAAGQAWQQYQQVLNASVLIEPEQAVQFQSQLSFQGLQVRIEAGYQDDFGLIANATTMANGIKHRFDGAGWVTTIKAQDNRYPWQNGFVNEPIAPGVTMLDWDTLMSLSEGYLEGTTGADVINAKFPELLVRKDFAGYANGGVLAGQNRDIETEMMTALGLTRFVTAKGERVYLDLNAVTADEAVVLQAQGPQGVVPVPRPGGLLSYEEQSRGYYTATTLLNYKCTSGRQVLLQDQFGAPIGVGTFRIDHVRHTGSSFDGTYYSELMLRPTAIPQAFNV
jgi:hypothetical protein